MDAEFSGEGFWEREALVVDGTPETADDVERIASQVRGWLTSAEGRMLYALARASSGPIVEVGSWRGKSTVWLAWGSKHGKRVPVYAIDHHQGSSEHQGWAGLSTPFGTYLEFWQNMREAGAADMVVPLVMSSGLAAQRFEDDSIDGGFIDASHEYDLVLQDFLRWDKKVRRDGWLAFHDCGWDGPGKVVREHVFATGEWLFEGQADSIIVVRKTHG